MQCIDVINTQTLRPEQTRTDNVSQEAITFTVIATRPRHQTLPNG